MKNQGSLQSLRKDWTADVSLRDQHSPKALLRNSPSILSRSKSCSWKIKWTKQETESELSFPSLYHYFHSSIKSICCSNNEERKWQTIVLATVIYTSWNAFQPKAKNRHGEKFVVSAGFMSELDHQGPSKKQFSKWSMIDLAVKLAEAANLSQCLFCLWICRVWFQVSSYLSTPNDVGHGFDKVQVLIY